MQIPSATLLGAKEEICFQGSLGLGLSPQPAQQGTACIPRREGTQCLPALLMDQS